MDKKNKIIKGQPSKRSFLKILWTCLGLVALGELIVVIFSFFKPISKKKAAVSALRIIDAGSTDTYTPGSVSAFVQGQFYLVRLEDGGFLALSGKCTHLGFSVPWDKEQNKFICPCHASQFDIMGNVLSSPASRALDLFEISIVNKNIRVNISNRIKRNRFNKSQLVYPETVSILEESNKK
ncbi:MAG: Rieske 2Fe-2S domain-containing protein [Desulfobacula sp.]|uniref:QcrA and Rieske domain-containing protein n=1 Tax=Desulfobacula sp. TaxID=2593537 RepID=UPI0025C4EDB0|nr:Rieske 2Fe-2S domain-containing protein [Desulfobacula sp.]MCD4721711.1 Rieske 2Fe-2S domain-containing protein [Desulfobacula sp.]